MRNWEWGVANTEAEDWGQRIDDPEETSLPSFSSVRLSRINTEGSEGSKGRCKNERPEIARLIESRK